MLRNGPCRYPPSGHIQFCYGLMRSDFKPFQQRSPRREFIKTVGAAALSFSAMSAVAKEEAPLPGTANSNRYPESSSSLKIADPSRIAILQLTDAHFFQKRPEIPHANERTVGDWKKMVDRYKPDVVCMTGDLWHENHEHRGEEYQRQAIAWLGELGVPWTFSWGNHDQLDDQAKGHDALHEGKNSLYRGGAQAGNYTVQIQDRSGKPVWELLCLNTHRLGLVGTASDWLTALGQARRNKRHNPTPAFAMFHIPLLQYEHLRTSGGMAGVTMEGVCYETEKGGALKQLSAVTTVRATFCGHDHTNDYFGIVDGVELVYGRSSGWSAYGFDQVRKGGKLVTVNGETGNYAWETVFPDGLRWHPKPGDHIEKLIDEPWLDPKRAPTA